MGRVAPQSNLARATSLKMALEVQGRDLTRDVTVTLSEGKRIPLGAGQSADIFRGKWKDEGQQKLVAIKHYRLALNDPPEIVEAVNRGNILINDQEQALLADFGRSKKIGIAGYTTALFCGSTRHMAPELFPEETPEGDEVDPDMIICMATDMYAFAMVCFEILTGNVPFKALRYDYQVISAIRRSKRPEPTLEVQESIPLDVWEIMYRCWDQDPGQRPSAGEVVEFLAKVPVS
ncbi:hypothetical protein HWV62_13403 [Athelia sp. TMB]|nr:hypothetical protein HWV62_13403 [Athelia sp. TMB]